MEFSHQVENVMQYTCGDHSKKEKKMTFNVQNARVYSLKIMIIKLMILNLLITNILFF